LSGFLLDTNIISELRRPHPEPRVSRFIAAQKLDALFLSVVTLAEIRFGIERLAEPEKRARLQEWLTQHVRPVFDGRILPVSEDVMLKWRLLVAEGRKTGHTYSQPDLIIAATAACHGLTVLSRDVSDFVRAGVAVVNPWEA